MTFTTENGLPVEIRLTGFTAFSRDFSPQDGLPVQIELAGFTRFAGELPVEEGFRRRKKSHARNTRGNEDTLN